MIGAAGDLAAAAAGAAADDRLAGVLDVRPAGGAGGPALALVRPDRHVAGLDRRRGRAARRHLRADALCAGYARRVLLAQQPGA